MTGPSALQAGLRATARAEGDNRCLLTITVTVTNNGDALVTGISPLRLIDDIPNPR